MPKKPIIDSRKHDRHIWCNTEFWDYQAGKVSAAFHLGGFDILHHFEPFFLAQQLSDMIFFFINSIILFAKSSSSRQTLHKGKILASLFIWFLSWEKQGYSQLNWFHGSVEATFTNQQLQINTLHSQQEKVPVLLCINSYYQTHPLLMCKRALLCFTFK